MHDRAGSSGFQRDGGRARAAWIIALFGATSALVVSACSEAPVAHAKPPIAALHHPSIARVGEKVRFSAADTWVDDQGDVLRDGAVVVRYEFLVADGSATRSTAAAFVDHVFESAGTFAVQVTVHDDLGRTSLAKSTVHIAADYAASCDSKTASQCASRQCAGDRCAVVACAGAKVCGKTGATSGATACINGACTQPASPTP